MGYYLQLVLMLFLSCYQFRQIKGGSCWLEVDKKNYADVNSFLKTNVTRQECCKLEPAGEKYFSEDEPLPEQKVWIWRFLQDHKCSMACQDGCTTFSRRCSDSELCRVKPNGYPKCICNPFCAKHPLSKKGKFCGDDGKTYSHHCQLLRQNCRKKVKVEPIYLGECKAFSCNGVVCVNEGFKCITDQYNRPRCVPTESMCSKSSQGSVCATDGQMYKSRCHMANHARNTGQALFVSHHGSCTGNPQKACNDDKKCKLCLTGEKSNSAVCISNPIKKCLPEDKSPAVCGEDGVTYKNMCAMMIASYKLAKHIKVAHVAACNATAEEMLAAGRYLDDPRGNHAQQVDYVFVSLIRNHQRIKRKLSRQQAHNKGYL